MARPPSPLKVPPNCKPSDEAFAVVVDELINEVILDFCFQVHRASKVGLYIVDPTDDEDHGKEPSEDIFGQVKGKHKLPNICCPHCPKKMEASRFICHLEKCMVGHGRQSGRNASRKIGAMESDCDDDENGSDSSYSSTKKRTKKKKSNAANKRRVPKESLAPPISEGSSMNASLLGGDNYGNCKAFLDVYCGVETKQNKKMCMNTLNCHAHTKAQKIDIRNRFRVNVQKPDDVQIDVDTVDGEGEVFMSQDVSRNTSPENEFYGED